MKLVSVCGVDGPLSLGSFNVWFQVHGVAVLGGIIILAMQAPNGCVEPFGKDDSDVKTFTLNVLQTNPP